MPNHAVLKPYRDLLDHARRHNIDWGVENGSKHYKLYVGGQFCSILPKSAPDNVSRNVIAARGFIRRRLEELGVPTR